MNARHRNTKVTEVVEDPEVVEDSRVVEFPALVYRCPGTHHCHGDTYDYLSVNNYDELGKAIENGWSESLTDAMDS